MRGPGRDIERLREMSKWAKAIEKSLDSRTSYHESSLALSRDAAARHAGRLLAWLDDMIFIAEAEHPNIGRSPATE